MGTILAELRAIIPQRPLSKEEAYQVAEQQALRLLRYYEIDEGPVPESVITSLPRLRVERISGMPVSGASKWASGSWMILLNRDEPLVRQRFSLAHEMLHVINHPVTDLIYPFSTQGDQYYATELIADHFAACLLMPKMWIKRSWYGGNQDVRAMAMEFGVSTAAIRYRLSNLGMTWPTASRCEQPSGRARR